MQINTDLDLEDEATKLGSRALSRGRSSSEPQPVPPTRPTTSTGIETAQLFAPAADTSAAATPGAATSESAQSPRQGKDDGKKTNELASFAHLDVDPRSGLQPDQERAVKSFVTMVENALQSWREQRATADLSFKRHSDVAAAFQIFRKATAADRYHGLIWREAARRLQAGTNKSTVREIRMFNPTMLGDLKKMLKVEDPEPSHQYEIQPQWGVSGGPSQGIGVKGGLVTKRVKIRYTNLAIKGMTWTQEVSLSGVQLGFGISTDTKGGMSGSISGPGSWDLARHQPQSQYLEPKFFSGAQFTSPGASASANLGPATAKKSLGSALLINKGQHKLLWEKPANWSVIDDVEAGVSKDNLTEAPKAGAGVEVTNEFGTTETQGEVDFTAGEWGELEGTDPRKSEAWVPLHYAKLFFATGSAALGDEDLKTLDQLLAIIQKWDKKEGYRGSIFKVEISGSHSSKWERYDDELKRLDEKREKKGKLSQKELQREGDLKAAKTIENYELALSRADITHHVFTTKLGWMKDRMVYGVLAKSKVEEPTTHEPIRENPYSNVDEDRSVTIVVSYQIFNPQGQVNWNQ